MILFDYWNQRPRGIYWIETLSAHSVREHDSSQFLEISRIQTRAFRYLRILWSWRFPWNGLVLTCPQEELVIYSFSVENNWNRQVGFRKTLCEQFWRPWTFSKDYGTHQVLYFQIYFEWLYFQIYFEWLYFQIYLEWLVNMFCYQRTIHWNH